MDYDEFGNVLQDTNPGFQPFGFAGGIYDNQTEKIRFGERDYDPVMGRWITKDQLGFGGFTTNLYAYSRNDPINFVDITGKIAALAVPLAVPLIPIILEAAAIVLIAAAVITLAYAIAKSVAPVIQDIIRPVSPTPTPPQPQPPRPASEPKPVPLPLPGDAKPLTPVPEVCSKDKDPDDPCKKLLERINYMLLLGNTLEQLKPLLDEARRLGCPWVNEANLI